MENKWSKYGMALVAGIPVALCLSVVCCGTSSLPADILEDDWRWMYGCGVLSLAGLALLVLLFPKRVKECLSAVVSWVFILYGGIEAVWGIRQVYGFTYSNHSLYALTGSFYNPGPYSGYLAMIFPVCLHEWLERKEHKKTVPYYIAIAGMLLILCVLPAGMSRSAWIAAAVSFIYVCGMHYKMEIQHYIRHHRKQAVSFAIVTFILGGIALGGIYQMKRIRQTAVCLCGKLLPKLSVSTHGQDADGTVFRLLTDKRRRIILQPEIIRQRRNLWQVLPNMFSMNICK